MYRERALLEGGVVLDLALSSPSEFFIQLKRQGEVVVEYRPGHRVVRGKRTAYEFKSVEKLRYDFEQDAQHSL